MDRDQTFPLLLPHRFVLRGHTDYVLSLAVSGDGRRLVSGAMDETVRVWDAGTGRKVAVLRGELVISVAISPDGRRLYIGSKAGTIRMRDADTGERLATMRGHRCGIYNMFFQNGGRELVTWDVNDESRVWNAATGECLASGQLPGTMWVGPNVPEDCPYQFTDRGQPTVIKDAAAGEPIAVVDQSFSSIAASNIGRWAGSNGSDIYVFDMADIGSGGDGTLHRRLGNWLWPWRT
jgi:WD40 repeat protein